MHKGFPMTRGPDRERDPVTGRFVGTLVHQHGTYSRYQSGCRCRRCKRANTDYFRAYRERKREGATA